jgi:hypothetical protein
MPDTPVDPVDHARTTRHFTGEAMKNTKTSVGLLLGATAVVAFVAAVYLFAVHQLPTAGLFSALALVLAIAGVLAIRTEHRRVVRHELRWLADHPDAYREPPTG